MESTILFLPELLLIASIIAIPALYIATENNKSFSICSNLSLFVSLLLLVIFWFYPDNLSLEKNSSTYYVYDHFKIDDFSQIFKIIFVITALTVSVMSSSYFKEDEPHQAEYYVLILSSTLGMLLVASATDFLTLFLGIEISAFSSYALVAFRKTDDLSTEAGAKYLLIGAFSSALTLYGVSLIYGLTGTTNFDGVNAFLIGLNNGVVSGNFNEIIFISSLFIIAGLGFKIAVVPFHAWAPDVYQGSPTPITAFFSVAPKAAGLALLIRFITSIFSHNNEIASAFNWPIIMAILSALTMTIGNVLAIKQSNVKRMLAYSSISHIGFIMMSLCVYTSNSDLTAILLYFFVYMFMNFGAFFLVIFIENKLGYKNFKEWNGLGLRMPFWGAMMAINMIALTGLPPTSGFIAKFYIFSDLIASKQFFWLVIIGVLNAVISLYYYFKLLKHMYLNESKNDEIANPGKTLGFIIVLFSLQSLIFYFYWNPLVDLLKNIGL